MRIFQEIPVDRTLAEHHHASATDKPGQNRLRERCAACTESHPQRERADRQAINKHWRHQRMTRRLPEAQPHKWPRLTNPTSNGMECTIAQRGRQRKGQNKQVVSG